MIGQSSYAPPFTGELSAKLTEGAVTHRAAPSVRRYATSTSPVNGGG